MEAWAAVVDHIESDVIMQVPAVRNAWDEYMDAKHRVRTHPTEVSVKWDRFLTEYEKAKEGK